MTGERNVGLILSGGGSRGAYQIGVWEALKEFHGLFEDIHTISGVSIGAINGALIIQELVSGSTHHSTEMWRNAVPGEVFNAVPDDLKNLEWKDYLSLGTDSLKHFKVRIDPFMDRLFELTKEDMIRSSEIDYVISAWNLTKLKTEVFPIKEIPYGELADFILASASFPAFGAYKIGEDLYLDGGIGNNLPIPLAMDKPEVKTGIAIDVGSFVRYRPSQMIMERKYKDQVLTIRPSRSIPSPANFSQSAILQMIEIGYEDGLKQLKRFEEILS